MNQYSGGQPPTPQSPPSSPSPAPQYAPPGFPQNAQHVVQHTTRHGIGGWLGAWMVVFTFGAIGYISSFFSQVGNDDARAEELVLFPILAALSVASVALLASRRIAGKRTAIAALAVSGLYWTIRIPVRDADASVSVTSGILITWVIHGALMLYFLQSDRVRQTLLQ